MITFVDNYTAILSGDRWSSADGLPTVVTYSFEARPQRYLSDSGFSQGFIDSFEPFTSQQEQMALRAMNEISATSGIIFVEVPQGQGDIRFGNYDFDQANTGASGGFAYYPYRLVNESFVFESEIGGDVFINSSVKNSLTYNLMLHEIGHAVGLEHPHDGEVQLQSQYDNGEFTVMSYNRDNRESGLGPFDDDALQHIYGGTKFTPSKDGGMEAFNYNERTKTVTQSWGDASSDILGSSLKDVVSGGKGDDNIGGFKGRDKLSGNGGNDVLYGGNDNDTLTGGKGDDTLEGGNGNDRSVGQAGDDMIFGDNGDDVLNGGGGFDQLNGDKGDDFLKGGTKADYMDGGKGDDRMFGNRDDDDMMGGAGKDKMNGGGGNDTLNGGRGRDTLKGGDGADYFIFNDGETLDIVEDFDTSEDQVQLDSNMLSGETSGQEVVDAYGSIQNGDAVLDFGGGNTIRFEGVTDLDALADQILIF